MGAKTGYRAFPSSIDHPSEAVLISEVEFTNLKRQNMREVPSAYERHLGTAIWYYGGKGYIANVRLENKADVFALSLCAFTPSFGMDKIDELFAQDIEESILNQKLGFSTERLDIFQGRKSVPVGEYLRARGVIE